jgi:putative peptidoglycan lipid II flippase
MTALLGLGIVLAPHKTLGFLLSEPEAAPGVDALFRSTGAALIFAALSGVLAGVLNAHERFLTVVATRVLFTATVLTALTLAPSVHLLTAAGLALLLGGFVQWFLSAWMLPGRAGFDPRCACQVPPTELRRLFRASALGLATFLVQNAGLGAVERSFLGRTGAGDLAAASLAQRTTTVAGLLAISLQTVTFTRIARAVDERDAVAYLWRSLRWGAALMGPSLLFFALLADPLVALVFERGRFGATEAARTAELVRWYSATVLPGFAFGILLRAVVAAERWAVALLSTGAMCVAATMLDLALLQRLSAIAIPIGNTVGATIGCAILWVAILRQTGRRA